jgi:glycosyltransferase involved in cell wall biosynthesis
MRIINIVDSVEKVNFGIWNAAIATTDILYKKYKVGSELWFPTPPSKLYPDELKQLTKKEVDPLKFIEINEHEDTIIISHGCWRFPTKWGSYYQKKGIPWIYVPQGMLEPWSTQQKWLKKLVYFQFIEKRLAKEASIIRAVSKPEFKNLKNTFEKVALIANCVNSKPQPSKKWGSPVKQYLFMSRLHYKKGILPLVKGWINSDCYNNNSARLIVAGPDQGELPKIKTEIEKSKCSNIIVTGPVYGDEKDKLLNESHFFLLPSFSEGFPTAVLEAMQFGLIPLISKGCNFPEAFENQLAIEVSPNEENIKNALIDTLNFDPSILEIWGTKAWQFIEHKYTTEKIADMQYQLYLSLLKK